MCQVSLNLNALLIKSCSIRVENLTSDLQVKATEIETHLRFLVDGISLKILHCLIVSQTGFFQSSHSQMPGSYPIGLFWLRGKNW